MVTKERLMELANQYSVGILRKLHLRSRYSDEMQQLNHFLQSLPTGALSLSNFVALDNLLKSATPKKESETEAVYKSIRKEIGVCQPYTLQYLHAALEGLFKLWVNNYYFDRAQSLSGALGEMIPCSASRAPLISHSLAALYLASAFYGMRYTEYSRVLMTLFASNALQTAAQKIHPTRSTQVKSLIAESAMLGLQVGLDLLTGAGGVIIFSYITAKCCEMLAGRIFPRCLQGSASIAKYQQRYPLSAQFLQKLSADVGFCSGYALGSRLHHYFTGPVPRFSLTEQERVLLDNEKSCKRAKEQCQSVALQVLGLDPSRLYTRAEIREAFKTLSLFYHPDKRLNSEAEMILLNNALQVLLPRRPQPQI